MHNLGSIKLVLLYRHFIVYDLTLLDEKHCSCGDQLLPS